MRLQALQHNPELLVIRPAPPSAGLNDFQSFNLSTALMTVHKDKFHITQHNPTKRPPPEEDFHRLTSVQFAAAHESARGTFETSRDVRISVAIGGKPDVARTAHFGSV